MAGALGAVAAGAPGGGLLQGPGGVLASQAPSLARQCGCTAGQPSCRSEVRVGLRIPALVVEAVAVTGSQALLFLPLQASHPWTALHGLP